MEARLALQFDARLETKARALATMTSYSKETGEYELEFADEVMPEFERPAEPEYFQIWVEEARVLERSRSLDGANLPRFEAPLPSARFRDLTLPSGAPGRAVQLDYLAQVLEDEEPREAPASSTSLDTALLGPPPFAAVVVAAPRRPLADAISELRWLAIAGASVLLAVLFLAARWAVVGGLAPLGELAFQVESIGPEDLSRRIDAATPTEVAPLVERINALLRRVDEALARERRISADVAHELRTPIAELRSLAEVGERWPQDRDATRAFFADARQIAVRMARTVETLLALARAEADIEPSRPVSVDLERALLASIQHSAAAARQRGVSLRLAEPPAIRIEIDADKLQRVLDNLVENAVAHSPRDAEVDISIGPGSTVEGRILVEFRNPAPQLDSTDLPHLTERFWRKEAARTSGHSGLGLPLVAELVRTLGGELDFSLGEAREFAVRLSLPSSPRR